MPLPFLRLLAPNDFIVGFGIHLSKHAFNTGYTFYLPLMLGKKGFVFYVIYSRPIARDGTRLPLKIVPRFRPLNYGFWHHAHLSMFCTVFSISRGYHFLTNDPDADYI